MAVLGSGVLMALALPGVPAAAAPAYVSLQVTNIQNYYTGLCILAPSTGSEIALVQAQCAGYADQKWEWQTTLSNHGISTTFRNSNSGYCLLARGQQEARQIPCDVAGQDAQWYEDIIDSGDPQWERIWNRATGKCLVPDRGGLNGLIVQADCDFGRNPPLDQRWRLKNV
ncbi:RICIN domain-containing protein [Kitasatospora sp. NPDC004799]|uniref:RICIN domain-containing protein n=1 Tax=Kitasatospora sp. NPDC004799 TaxID=3154460 RepID=UPI0033AC5D1D